MGRRADRRDRGGTWLVDGQALRQRDGRTIPSRCSWSSSWRWRRRDRSSGSPSAGCTRVARLGGATPAAWWVAILTIAPLMGSFITEPAAMTIAAVLLGRQFYDLNPSPRLKYATLGLLFVNVSIGGTLTHFAAPPVLMVARHWDWDTAFMATHIGWRAAVAIVLSTAAYFAIFRGELQALSRLPPVSQPERPEEEHRRRREGRAPAGAGVGDGGARAVHRLDGRQLALPGAVSRRLSLLPRLRARHRGVSEPRRSARAAPGRLLPRRTGHPRRSPVVVDRARAREPVRTQAVSSARRSSRPSTTTRSSPTWRRWCRTSTIA